MLLDSFESVPPIHVQSHKVEQSADGAKQHKQRNPNTIVRANVSELIGQVKFIHQCCIGSVRLVETHLTLTTIVMLRKTYTRLKAKGQADVATAVLIAIRS